MTAIRGTIGVNKRPGELGAHSLDSFRMAVPDLTVAEKFYTEFGLEVREEGNGLGLYTHGNSHRWMSLSEGLRKELQGFTFGVFEEDFEPMKKRIEAQGVKLMDAPRGQESNSIWFADNNGLMIEMKIAEKTSLDAKADFGGMETSVPANEVGSWSRRAKPQVSPIRFAHMLVFTPSVPQSIEFYSRVLGLRLSDRTGDIIAFMHGIHGCDHHMIAFVDSGGKAPGLHHCSWDMGSLNGIGLAAQQMADAGYTEGWGLGRHVLGSNYFHYMKDPWGSWAEYSADIDYISLDKDWEAKNHPEEDGIYVWGPELPEDFVHNYEADQ
ncbi:VOC family protein [Celeribacter baekdonensis]|jgi:catechol 2,3-dioxygenase-like lactoylglutathione lyase family enzyme|uniref:Metapyrocatechase n=1 Tax=Celeribacter baekdonensis TaxID=875171 RepID=A0A2R4M1P4_9RHOB|nr:VOC family protein [Celeribacter baekdonensis]AVW91083.1 metapyrocatechase [Celeribacter baekdonensis]